MPNPIREFLFPQRLPPPKKVSYPEPKKPSGPPPKTEQELALLTAGLVLGPLYWMKKQIETDIKVKPWKKISVERFLGRDPYGEPYTLDLRGNWGTFLRHPLKTFKKAAKSLLIRKTYDWVQGALLSRYHARWQAGEITQQEYLRFVSLAVKARKWIAPRDWLRVHTPQGWQSVSTTLTKGTGRLWEWLEFIDHPFSYTGRKFVWKKGAKPVVSKITKPVGKVVSKVTKPVGAAVRRGVKAAGRVVAQVGRKAAVAAVQVGKVVAAKAAAAVSAAVAKIFAWMSALTAKVAAAAAAAGVTAAPEVIIALAIIGFILLALFVIIVMLFVIFQAMFGAIGGGEPGVTLPPVQIESHRIVSIDGDPAKTKIDDVDNAYHTVELETGYKNTAGSIATDVSLVIDFDGAEFVSCSSATNGAGCGFSGNTITWNLGELAPGESGSAAYKLRVLADEDKTIPIVATLSSTIEGEEQTHSEIIFITIGTPPEGCAPNGLPLEDPIRGTGWTWHDPRNPTHNGIDVTTYGADKTVYSTFSCKSYVVSVGGSLLSPGGYYITLKSGIYGTYYGHLKSIPSFRVGEEIGPNAAVGVMNATGTNCEGDHVHYMVYDENWVPIDPRDYGVPSPPW